MTLTVSKVMLEYKPLRLNKNTFPFMYMLQTIKLKLVFNNVSPAFAIEVQGVRLTFHLFQKAITWPIIDLGQKFLLVSAIYGLPFCLKQKHFF